MEMKRMVFSGLMLVLLFVAIVLTCGCSDNGGSSTSVIGSAPIITSTSSDADIQANLSALVSADKEEFISYTERLTRGRDIDFSKWTTQDIKTEAYRDGGAIDGKEMRVKIYLDNPDKTAYYAGAVAIFIDGEFYRAELCKLAEAQTATAIRFERDEEPPDVRIVWLEKLPPDVEQAVKNLY